MNPFLTLFWYDNTSSQLLVTHPFVKYSCRHTLAQHHTTPHLTTQYNTPSHNAPSLSYHHFPLITPFLSILTRPGSGSNTPKGGGLLGRGHSPEELEISLMSRLAAETERTSNRLLRRNSNLSDTRNSRRGDSPLFCCIYLPLGLT